MTWLVLVTFLFPGHQATQWQKLCHDQACIAEIAKAADADPNVIRFRVLQPGDGEVTRGFSVQLPITDEKKT